MASCDYDWLFIDMEHNSMDIDIASQISVAAQDAGITPIVRVPDFAHHHATRVLDCGAMGIVFPHVENADVAKKLVSFCLFPPKGHRSMTGSLPQLNFKSMPISEVATTINDNMLIVVMLESPEAIENVDEIAAVSGVDVILIGTNDLCMEMGIPGDYSNPKIKEAYTKVIKACEKYNKTPGMPISIHKSFVPISITSTPETAAISSTFSIASGLSNIITISILSLIVVATSEIGIDLKFN